MTYGHRITGDHKIRLRDYDSDQNGGLSREEAEERTSRLNQRLRELQELLYAAGQTAVLIVLQGRDTSGKDGTVRHVMSSLNPQGCDVASFKVPTALELAHDFLWRIHARTPARGRITIFNRSHYEDVLVVRVHNLLPKEAWRARYEQINQFERSLADSDTVILKFYLHISRGEQEKRLIEREQDATKAWKLSVDDWRERERWDAYTKAYEDAINRCSAPYAPWFIVPADKKWFRNLAVADAVVDALKPFKQGWLKHLQEIGREQKAKLRQFRRRRG